MINFQTGQITFNKKYTIYSYMNYSDFTDVFSSIAKNKICMINEYTHVHINNLLLNNTRWNIIFYFNPDNRLQSIHLWINSKENRNKTYKGYLLREQQKGRAQNKWFRKKYNLNLLDETHLIKYDWGYFISGYHPKFEKALTEFRYE